MAPKIEPREDTLSGISQNATSVPPPHYGQMPRGTVLLRVPRGDVMAACFLRTAPRPVLSGMFFSSLLFLIYYKFNFYKDLWVLGK